jgi:hypothetical protein
VEDDQKYKIGQETSTTSQGTWARSNVEKAHTFAEHLANFFSYIPQKMNLKRKKHLYNFLRPLTS